MKLSSKAFFLVRGPQASGHPGVADLDDDPPVGTGVGTVGALVLGRGQWSGGLVSLVSGVMGKDGPDNALVLGHGLQGGGIPSTAGLNSGPPAGARRGCALSPPSTHVPM